MSAVTMWRRALRGLAGLVLGLVVALAPAPAAAGPALVFDVRSGEVLHAHMPFARWYPASLTKMMTTYVALHAVRSGRARLDQPVVVSERALAQPPSKMGFPVGTSLSLDYALRIIMVRSANDISVAIGESVSGSLEGFIAEMNRAAARLGMTDTHFTNPHGLPDARQVSTARDLGLLARALIVEFPDFQYLLSTEAIQVGTSTLRNHNRLLGRFPGADGMKTGYTCSSGFNLAASATRNGRRIVAIVLGGATAATRNEVTAALLEAAFEKSAGLRLFAPRGPRLTDLARPAGVTEPVDLRPYVCQRRPMPEHLASFGPVGQVAATAGTGTSDAAAAAPASAAASLAASSASGAAVPLLAMPDPDDDETVSALPPPGAEPARGATARTIPLPRPRPDFEGRAAEAAPPPTAFRGREDPAAPVFDFLRTPVQ